MADRYNTPGKGTSNWHVPLNENFDRLDKDVEIRDVDSNLDGYEPTSDAKFFATDTGSVYIGDGDEWNQLGWISGSSTLSGGSDVEVGADMPDGTVVAEPGEVQATLDAAKGEGYGKFNWQKVSLVAGTVYETTAPIRVPKGVMLDCNGATILPQGDHNVLELDGNTLVYRPWIRTGQVNGFSSVGIEVGAKWAGPVNDLNPVRVENAWIHGEPGNGVGVRFRGGDSPVGPSASVRGKVWRFDKGIEFRSFGDGVRAGSDGDWVTGCEFHGFLGRCRIPVYLESGGAAVSGNIVCAQIQPNRDLAEWAVKQADDPRDLSASEYLDNKKYKIRGNTYMLKVWDEFAYKNDYGRSDDLRHPLWYIGQGHQPFNHFIDTSGKLSNEYIVNNAFRAETNGLFTAQAGPSWGAVDYDTGTKEYKPKQNRKNWHPGSNPGA